ncbi:unnamed protein product [Rotaria sordida]|uniref:Uncharacterized protein n=1 Tax=Rotaria sordida TaxID=392033 RepID=A0A814SMP6_9BILA|nr:unnamed protein product [Rotaria sordida]CAF1273325.1 unnamed protein product [Rotaria sordida]
MNTSALSNKGTLTKSAIGKIEAKKETHSSKAQKKTATPTFTNIVNIEISSTVKKVRRLSLWKMNIHQIAHTFRHPTMKPMSQ